jgi:small GTP-binding protein
MFVTKKIVFIGSYGVGKTSLLNRLLSDKFNNIYNPTSGVNVYPVHRRSSKPNVLNIFNIWDCSGQIKYGKPHETYWNGMTGVVIMFDLTSPATWHAVPSYVKHIRKLYPDVSILICGNKSDSNLLKLQLKTIVQYCNDMKIPYCEISVKNNIKCDRVLSYFI